MASRKELSDRLQPYWDTVDTQVIRISDLATAGLATPLLHGPQIGYFRSSALNLKAVWYLRSQIERLDVEYGELVGAEMPEAFQDGELLGPASAFWTRRKDGTWYYLPFFEVVEFQHLLTTAGASLELMAQGIGALFSNQPHNLKALA